MLPIIIKFIIGLIMAITSMSIANKTLKKKSRITLQSVLIIVILAMPTVIFYRTEYNVFVSISTYVLSIILFRKYLNINLFSSILICSYAVMLVAISDIIVSSINSFFITYEELRTVGYIVIINNIAVSLLSCGISSIPLLKNKVYYLCQKTEKNANYNIIAATILCIFTVTITFYNITTIFKINMYYTVTLISTFVLLLLYYFYVNELNNYEKLNDEYNTLFDYVQNFENWIDDEQMCRHELNNSLSMIRNMTKNKAIINKIDEMLNMNVIIDDQYIELLKYVPKGGLKGLIYYKIALAKNMKVKMIIEVSPKVTNLIKKMSGKNLRKMCIVLGIYLDNALEAASISKKKSVTLEIYEVNNKLSFVISNTYKDLISIKSMRKKGFTTKGENRGKGLYYVSKVISKTKWLKVEQIFLNNYFIQKLYIK